MESALGGPGIYAEIVRKARSLVPPGMPFWVNEEIGPPA